MWGNGSRWSKLRIQADADSLSRLPSQSTFPPVFFEPSSYEGCVMWGDSNRRPSTREAGCGMCGGQISMLIERLCCECQQVQFSPLNPWKWPSRPSVGKRTFHWGRTQYAHFHVIEFQLTHTNTHCIHIHTHTCICTDKYMHVQPDGTHKPECWRYTHKPERGATPGVV